MTIIPSPQQVVQVHRSLLRLAVEALRRGTLHAQEYVEWQDEPIDRALSPAHVRKGAKRYLIETNQDVQDEEGSTDYEAEFLANLGLLLKSDGVQLRLLRSAAGNMMPVPGQSQARQSYYSQPGLPFGEVENAVAVVPDMLRLVLHWSTDDEYNLDHVYLACPKSGGETRSTVESHWDEPIWRRHSLEVDVQVQAEVTDLDIHLDATGTGS